MKVSELEGAELDYWVAKAEGENPEIGGSFEKHCFIRGENKYHGEKYIRATVKKNWRGKIIPESLEPIGWCYEPSKNWSQGGPIILREKIAIVPFSYENDETVFGAEVRKHKEPYIDKYDSDFDYIDKSPLVAAMRAFVASKFGENV